MSLVGAQRQILPAQGDTICELSVLELAKRPVRLFLDLRFHLVRLSKCFFR